MSAVISTLLLLFETLIWKSIMNTRLKKTLLVFPFFIVGCSTVDIRDVEPEKLKIDVSLTQTSRSTGLDVFLSRGMFHQAVTAKTSVLEAEFADGSYTELVRSTTKGRFGFKRQNTIPVTRLDIEDTGSIEFPSMAPVVIKGREQFEGASFFKDDLLTISLPSTQSDKRYIVATGYCGAQGYTAEMQISSNEIDLELPLSRIINMVNKAAEADLNGVIPIVLAVEERYFPVWQPPFIAKKVLARDETQFSIDTSGFRFKATVSINVSPNMMFGFQNQALDVLYCL